MIGGLLTTLLLIFMATQIYIMSLLLTCIVLYKPIFN